MDSLGLAVCVLCGRGERRPSDGVRAGGLDPTTVGGEFSAVTVGAWPLVGKGAGAVSVVSIEAWIPRLLKRVPSFLVMVSSMRKTCSGED